MSFDWSDYLTLAHDMRTTADSSSTREARLRSCVSRAYYAAFCKARNYLRDEKGYQFPTTATAHALVRKAFQRSSDAKRRQIGRALNRLRIDRNKADYDDRINRLSSMANLALESAENILQVLKTI